MAALAYCDLAGFRQWHADTLADLYARKEHDREPWWTEAAAVGDRAWISSLADRYPESWRTVRQLDAGEGFETWTMGMSRRRREGFLSSFD